MCFCESAEVGYCRYTILAGEVSTCVNIPITSGVSFPTRLSLDEVESPGLNIYRYVIVLRN